MRPWSEPPLCTDYDLSYPECAGSHAVSDSVLTADEIWQAMPHAAEDDARNVAYNEMPQADEALSFSDEDRAKWDKLTAFRDDVNKALEVRVLLRPSASRWKHALLFTLTLNRLHS